MHGTLSPATHVTPSPHGRSEVRVDVSSVNVGVPGRAASVVLPPALSPVLMLGPEGHTSSPTSLHLPPSCSHHP